MQYDTITEHQMPEGTGVVSFKIDTPVRGWAAIKFVTLEGPLACYGVTREGQLTLLGADEHVIVGEFGNVKHPEFVEYLLTAPADTHFSQHRRLIGQGQEMDPIPAKPIVDEIVEDDMEQKILKLLRKYIPDAAQADDAFERLGDIWDEEVGPEADEDIDLDHIFLEEGPQALVAHFEARHLGGPTPPAEPATEEPAPDPEPPAPDPNSE